MAGSRHTGAYNYKTLLCTDIPELFLDKYVARSHFGRFGSLVNFVLRPRRMTCTVSYATEAEAELALLEGGMYNGHRFHMSYAERESEPAHKTEEWVDPDVQAELSALTAAGWRSEYPTDKHSGKSSSSLPQAPQVAAAAAATGPPRYHPPPASTRERPNSQFKELESVMRRPAHTSEEKYRVLDARDKLLRLKRKQQHSSSGATQGHCPDMCPEKERLLREFQRQVAVYELQAGSDVHICPKKALKQYSRSSADQETPLPHELRNEEALHMTMSYLMHEIMDLSERPANAAHLGDWFHFVWDRTRSIRKEITQQELCSLGAVKLVEQCARFHIHCAARLVAEDPSVFDSKINAENLTKCLQTLKYMYHDLRLKGVRCPRESEFRGYIVLLNLADANFLWDIGQLPTDLQSCREVRQAIQFYLALHDTNFVRFFQLVREEETSYLSACILIAYFARLRVLGLHRIIQAYRAPRKNEVSTLPLEYIAKMLWFGSDQAAASLFVEHYGMEVTEAGRVQLNKMHSMEADCKLSRQMELVESKRQQSVGECICGEPLPPRSLYLDHHPHNSFNEHSVLRSVAWSAEDQLPGRQQQEEQRQQDERQRQLEEQQQQRRQQQEEQQQQEQQQQQQRRQQQQKQEQPPFQSGDNIFFKVPQQPPGGMAAPSASGFSFAQPKLRAQDMQELADQQQRKRALDTARQDALQEAIAVAKKREAELEAIQAARRAAEAERRRQKKVKEAEEQRLQEQKELEWRRWEQEQEQQRRERAEEQQRREWEQEKQRREWEEEQQRREWEQEQRLLREQQQQQEQREQLLQLERERQQQLKEQRLVEQQQREERQKRQTLACYHSVFEETLTEMCAQQLELHNAATLTFDSLISEMVGEIAKQELEKSLYELGIQRLYWRRWRNYRGVQQHKDLLFNQLPLSFAADTTDSLMDNRRVQDSLRLIRRYRQGVACDYSKLLAGLEERTWLKLDLWRVLDECLPQWRPGAIRFYKLLLLLGQPSGPELEFDLDRGLLQEPQAAGARVEPEAGLYIRALHQGIALSVVKIKAEAWRDQDKERQLAEQADGIICLAGVTDVRHLLPHLKQLIRISRCTDVAIILQYASHDAWREEPELPLRELGVRNFSIFPLRRGSASTSRDHLMNQFKASVKFLATRKTPTDRQLQQSELREFLVGHLGRELFRRLKHAAEQEPAIRRGLQRCPQYCVDLYNEAVRRLQLVAGEDLRDCPRLPDELRIFVDPDIAAVSSSSTNRLEFFEAGWQQPERRQRIVELLELSKLPKMSPMPQVKGNGRRLEEDHCQWVLDYVQLSQDDDLVESIAVRAINCLEEEEERDDEEEEVEKGGGYTRLVELLGVERLLYVLRREVEPPERIVYKTETLKNCFLSAWYYDVQAPLLQREDLLEAEREIEEEQDKFEEEQGNEDDPDDEDEKEQEKEKEKTEVIKSLPDHLDYDIIINRAEAILERFRKRDALHILNGPAKSSQKDANGSRPEKCSDNQPKRQRLHFN